MKEKNYPYWIVPSERVWKERKRREWAAVIKAAEKFSLGSAFTPEYKGAQSDFYRLLSIITKKLSQKEWGR